MKNTEELKTLSLDELKGRLEDAQEEYHNLMLQKATHQINNPLRIREVRREIARIKTFIRQHELGIIKPVNANE